MNVADRGGQDAGHGRPGEAAQPSLPVPVKLPNIGLLLEVGKQRRKHIKRLKRGDGRLKRQIQAALDGAREELGIDRSTEIVPVVILYRYPEPDYMVSHAKD
jgi:hypothetical protein